MNTLSDINYVVYDKVSHTVFYLQPEIASGRYFQERDVNVLH